MGITGKYNFTGIQKLGSAAIKALLASTTWGAAILQYAFVRDFLNFFTDLLVNWLANKGLIILNIAASMVEGELDQSAFDKAMDQGIASVQNQILTPEQIKAIDDKVIYAVEKFGPLNPS